jgi:hypothetical protein
MNEKLNTFRALKEEDLLVTSRWCRFGWHTWTKYREPERVRSGIYTVTRQTRRCGSCNIADQYTIKKEY